MTTPELPAPNTPRVPSAISPRVPSPNARRLAWLVAIGIDATQALLPIVFGPGIVPWEIALDLIAMGVLTKLIGWHWAFLPTFAIELLPMVDLVPTWTAAMWFATRAKR